MQLRFSARFAALSTAVVAGAIIIAADLGLLPLRRIFVVPLLDKLGHFILFGALSWAVVRAAIEAVPRRSRVLVAAVCCLGVAAMASVEELSQLYIAARTFSPWDLLASCTGILAMAALQVGLLSGRVSPEPGDAMGRRA